MGGNLLCLFLELDSADFAVSAGASGAVFAVMGAMIYAVIRGRGHIEDLSTRQVVIMAAFSLLFWFYKRRSGQCGTCRRSHLWIPACSSALSPFAACRINRPLFRGCRQINIKAEPWPGVLETLIWPWCAEMISAVTASPRPVPSGLYVMKGWKIFSVCLCVIPHPLSLIQMQMPDLQGWDLQ